MHLIFRYLKYYFDNFKLWWKCRTLNKMQNYLQSKRINNFISKYDEQKRQKDWQIIDELFKNAKNGNLKSHYDLKKFNKDLYDMKKNNKDT